MAFCPFQEVTRELELTLASVTEVRLRPTAANEVEETGPSELSPPPPLRTEALAALLVAVRRCLAPTVMLKQLSSRFLRLVLQVKLPFLHASATSGQLLCLVYVQQLMSHCIVKPAETSHSQQLQQHATCSSPLAARHL